jgi:hypothetical protein
MFDWKYYLDKYPSLRANGIKTEKQAKEHWITFGQKEGRVSIRTPEGFDWNYYLDKYPDLRKNGVKTEQQAIEHWKLHGEKEGRQMSSPSSIKNKLCIVSIFKNEAHIFEEWISHYIKEGVDVFYLIDNGSTDNYMSILDKYIKKGIVILNIDNSKYQQEILYNKYYLESAKKCEWVIVVDLDEFMYARNGFNTMKDYLKSLKDNINHICIPWKMFGSNGHITQPNNVINNFLLRSSTETTLPCKSIIRGSALKKLKIHSSETNKMTGIYSSSGVLSNCDPNKQCVSEEILLNSMIHLNHYAIQSFEWFKNIKMTRGGANTLANEKTRTLTYFEAYDHKDTVDDELKKKRMN